MLGPPTADWRVRTSNVTAPAIQLEQAEFFEAKIRPILVEHCFKCHGPEKQEAGLRLDSREAILRGTDAGPVVVPGHPEESPLIDAIGTARRSRCRLNQSCPSRRLPI